MPTGFRHMGLGNDYVPSMAVEVVVAGGVADTDYEFSNVFI